MVKTSTKAISIVFLALVLLNLLNINKIQALDKPGFNILIINSYHQGHHWESDVLEGVNRYVGGYDDINLNIEYLDFRNKSDDEYIDYFKKLMNKKYPKGTIDVLYTVDDEAYGAFSEEVLNPKSSFYDIPLVFSGANHESNGVYFEDENDIKEKDYSVGLYSRDDNLNLLNLIRRLTPDIKTINVIIEDSKYGESIQVELDLLVDKYFKNYIELRYIKSNYMQDILKQLSELEHNEITGNIIAGEFQNKNSKKYMNPDTVINNIKEYTNAPIYSNDPTYIDSGILGGHIDIGNEHGAIIGQMLMEIKNGIQISSIENQIEPIAKPYVNYDSIYEYNVDPFDIGNDIIVINKGLFELIVPKYIKKILSILVLIAMIIILAVSHYIIKYRKEIRLQKIERDKSIEREKLKTDFIVNLSYELRTPINIILGVSRVIELGLTKDEVDKNHLTEKLNNIRQNSYRLLKISNNIIDITKVEEGMFKLNLENTNIVDIIENTFISTVDFASSKKIEMVFDTDEEEIITAIDIVQIKRVLLNLLSNSIKFTDTDGKIYVSIKRESEYVSIEVKDNGVGISKSNLKSIFDRFYQVDSILTRKSEGSGIGLCIVRDIVNMHDGEVEVESELNEGSTFIVKIPIKLIDNQTISNSSKFIETNRIVDLELSDI